MARLTFSGGVHPFDGKSLSKEKNEKAVVEIDNDICRNVAIRGKGNTSLTQVESYGNDRYSFKIQFDYYIIVFTAITIFFNDFF